MHTTAEEVGASRDRTLVESTQNSRTPAAVEAVVDWSESSQDSPIYGQLAKAILKIVMVGEPSGGNSARCYEALLPHAVLRLLVHSQEASDRLAGFTVACVEKSGSLVQLDSLSVPFDEAEGPEFAAATWLHGVAPQREPAIHGRHEDDLDRLLRSCYPMQVSSDEVVEFGTILADRLKAQGLIDRY